MKILFQLAINNIRKYFRESFLVVISIALTISMVTITAITMSSLYSSTIENNKESNPFNAKIYGIKDLNKFLDELGESTLEYYEVTRAKYQFTSEDQTIYVDHNSYHGNLDAIPKGVLSDHFTLKEGRLSENINEVVIPSNSQYKIGDVLELVHYNNIEQKEETFNLTIVGVNKSEYSYYYTGDLDTIFDNDDFGYSVNLVFKDGVENIDSLLNGMKEKDIFVRRFEIDLNTDYNYLKGMQSKPGSVMYTFIMLAILLIVIIGLVTATLILNAFETLLSQKYTTYSILRTLGATKSQLRLTILFEGFILTTIALILGLFIGIGLSNILLDFIVDTVNKINQYNFMYDINIIIIKFFPKKVILVICIISYLIIGISLLKKSQEVFKYSAIENLKNGMKKNKNYPLKKENLILKLSKINVESTKDYKGIKIGFILTSILLIVINTYAVNIMAYSDNALLETRFDTTVTSNSEGSRQHDKDIALLENLIKSDENINDYMIIYTGAAFELNSDLNKYINKEEESFYTTSFSVLDDESFKKLKSSLNLEADVNTIFYNIDSIRYSDNKNFKRTVLDIKDGDYIYARMNEWTTLLKDKDIKVEKVIEDLPIDYTYFTSSGRNSRILMSKTYFNNNYSDISELYNYSIQIDSSFNIDTLKEFNHNLKDLGVENVHMYSNINIIKTNTLIQESVHRVSVATFIYFALIILVNLFSVTLTNTRKRKRDFAVYKTIGMENKQLLKMVFYESLRTLVIPCIGGILVGNSLSYIIYVVSNTLFTKGLSPFTLQYSSNLLVLGLLLLIIIIQILVVFIEKRKGSIIETVREY